MVEAWPKLPHALKAGILTMDNADIFHDKMKEKGGRLDMAALHPATAQGFDYAATRARGFLNTAATKLPQMPPIYFDFVDNWQVNAWCFPAERRYFIGVTRGAVAMIGLLFDRMLADPRILPWWGAEEEVADLPLIPALGRDFVQAVASVPEFPRPRGPARQGIAGRLMDTAFDFLVAHEFAHIANGHLDHSPPVGRASAIDEVGMAPGTLADKEFALLSQTREMDADCTAALISLSSEWGKVAGRVPRHALEEIYRYPGLISLLWSYAVSTMCRIFGDLRLIGEEVMLEPYPRWRLRSAMIHQQTGRVPRPPGLTHASFVGHGPYRIPKLIKAAYDDVETIFSILTGKPEAREGLDDAWGDVGKQQMHRLRHHWRTKLKGELVRFAHQPLNNYDDPGNHSLVDVMPEKIEPSPGCQP